MATGTNIGSLFWSTGIDTTGLRRDSKKAQGALSGLFNPAILGAAALTGAILKAGDAALQFSRDFETAFAEVQTISQFARENADAMRDSLLELTTKIPVQAVDATRALYQIVSAGFDGADAMRVLEVSAKAAVAGVSTTAVAADTLTTIINAYGLSADEVTNVSDALFKTVELGKTTLSELGASFSQVAGLGAAYKIELNDILAATAQLTSQGASTSEAITRIRGGIVALSKEFGPAVFQGRSLAEAFQFARDEADKAGEGYEDFFGRVEAVVGILGLTGKELDNYTEKLEQVNTAAGSTEAALETMNGTLESQETLLRNNVNILLGQFGDTLSGIKKDILPGVNRELAVLADDTIPGYAKALSVLANAFNVGLLAGGSPFTAEQFSPEIVKFQKEAEREAEKFNKRTSKLSNEEFQKEVERIKLLQKENSDAFKNLQDRKTKGQQFDEDQLKRARQSNLTFYKVLEEAEKRLAKIREKTPPPGGEGGDVKTKKPRIFQDVLDDIADAKNAVNESTKSQIQDATDRVKALEKERDEWIAISNAVEVATETVKAFNQIKDAPVSSSTELKGVTKIAETVTGQLKPMKQLTSEQKKQLQNQSTQASNDATRLENSEKLVDDLLKSANALDAMAELISKFDEGLGSAVSQAAELAISAANIIEGLSSGNPTQVITGIAKGISALITTKEVSETETYEKAVRELTEAYKGLNFEIDKALGQERITSRAAAIANIEAQIQALKDLIKAEEEATEKIKFLGITIKTRSATDQSAIEEYTSQIEDLNREIQQILIDTTELITGTSGSALANALVDAFQVGENAAKEFGDVVNDVLKTAVQDALARKFLEQPLQDAIDQLGEDLTDGTADGFELTRREASRFKSEVTRIGEVYANALESVGESLGIDFGGGQQDTETGIAGAIRREITEDTAGLILGQFTAMRVDLKGLNEVNINQFEVLAESSGYLQQIEINTRSNLLISDVLLELQAMNTNLKNNL
jgi:hypothetical protein